MNEDVHSRYLSISKTLRTALYVSVSALYVSPCKQFEQAKQAHLSQSVQEWPPLAFICVISFGVYSSSFCMKVGSRGMAVILLNFLLDLNGQKIHNYINVLV